MQLEAQADLKKQIREIADFPKKGILFRDITPLLLDPESLQKCVDIFYENLPHKNIDKVIGIESRGFFFSILLAQKLNAGFVPVRKKGKLPYHKVEVEYQLEYGSDILEMHSDAIQPGDKALVHDDVLATGGTMQAVCQMLDTLGAEIVQCNFLIELDALKGRERLDHYPIYSMLHY